MKRIFFFTVLALGGVAGGLLGSAGAAEDKPVWSIKSYACQGDMLREGFVVESKGRLHLPDPPEDGEGEETRKFIRQSSAVFREYLKTAGVDLPEGSLVVLDRARHTLAARTTAEGHEALEGEIKEWESLLPRVLAFQVQVVAAAADEMRKLLDDAAGASDHGALLDRLESEAEQGRAKVVGAAQIETKSGQRSTMQMVTEREFVTEFAARADGSNEGTTREIKPVGLRVELDPVVGADGKTIDFIVAIHQSLSEPTMRWAPLGTLAGKRVEGEVTDFQEAVCSTSTTLLSGQTRLLAAWPAEEGTLQAGFVTAHCPAVRVDKDGRAEAWLRAHGDAVQPVPDKVEKADEDLGIPEGMILRKFRVPPDFFSMGRSGEPAAPAEPFAAAPRGGSAEPLLTVRMTVQDILKAEGISFPPGSSATYNKAKGELLVRNTRENMALVKAYLDSIIWDYPSVLQLRLHVVEAGSALVRRLGRESLAVTDHRAALEALLAEVAAGRGRVVETAMIEAKSGQRCLVKSGASYMHLDPNLSAQVSVPKSEKATVVVADAGTPELIASSEWKPLGLEWEIDPTLGGDGYTVDLLMAVKRQSKPPTERFAAPEDGDAQRIDAPTVSFHPLELNTAFTTVSGMKRLIGIWQPVSGEGTLNQEVMQAVFVEARVVALLDWLTADIPSK